MPFSTINGTSSNDPVSPSPSNVTDEYIDGNFDVSSDVAERRSNERSSAVRTYRHRIVQDLGRYGEHAVNLARYLNGTRTKITYYWRMVSDQERTIDSAIDTSSIEPTYVRINDFEVVLPDGLDYNYNPDEGASTYTGTMVFYPGITPHIGDVFLHNLNNRKVGKFSVTSVNPLSIRSGTCHETTVSLIEYVDQADIDVMDEQVGDVLFFEHKAYLDHDSVLLTSSNKQLIEDLDKAKTSLQHQHIKRFFNTGIDNLVRPDGVYDPYLAEFMYQVVDASAYPSFPRLHDIDKPYSGWSFWDHLLNPDQTPGDEIVLNYKTEYISYDGADVRIGPLINKYVLVLCDQTDEDALEYISTGLTTLSGEEESEFDQLVRLYMEHQKIDPMMLLEQVKSFHLLTEEEQFYQGPVYMYFASLLQTVIRAGRRETIIGSAVEYKPTVYEFTADDQYGPYIITVMDNRALGVIDENGAQHPFESGEVTYQGQNIQCDLRRVLIEVYTNWQFPEILQPVRATWIAETSQITVHSGGVLEAGMAVENVPGIPAGTLVESVSGETVTLDRLTEAGDDQIDVEVKIGWPVISGSWKLVLTGNTVVNDEDPQEPIT